MEKLEKSVGFHDYRPAACLQVTGEDALPFLQGQFTQELRPGRSAGAEYGLWLNQKGRVLADSTVVRVGEQEMWVISERCTADVIRERLEAYVIADDVVVVDHTAAWYGRALLGPEAADWLRGAIGGTLPEASGFVRVGEGFVYRGRRGVAESWEWLSPEPLPPVATLPALTANDLACLRIVAGIPLVPIDVGPGELPNEGGLEQAAISYTKGCYLGQEVMARLKTMGRVRRRLLRVEAPALSLPSLPADLFQGDKKVGELRSAAVAPGGGVVGLALCTLLALDPAAPLALSAGGPGQFVLRDLP